MKFEEGWWQGWCIDEKRSRVVRRGYSRLEELQELRCGGGNVAGMLRVQRREALENRKTQGQRVWVSLDVWLLQHEEAIIHPSVGERGGGIVESDHHHHYHHHLQ